MRDSKFNEYTLVYVSIVLFLSHFPQEHRSKLQPLNLRNTILEWTLTKRVDLETPQGMKLIVTFIMLFKRFSSRKGRGLRPLLDSKDSISKFCILY